MPKLYDFKKAKELIDIEVDNADVDKVFLGTLSDYYWTAETVWEKGKYIIDLGKVKTIAGIPGSDWILQLSIFIILMEKRRNSNVSKR